MLFHCTGHKRYRMIVIHACCTCTVVKIHCATSTFDGKTWNVLYISQKFNLRMCDGHATVTIMIDTPTETYHIYNGNCYFTAQVTRDIIWLLSIHACRMCTVVNTHCVTSTFYRKAWNTLYISQKFNLCILWGLCNNHDEHTYKSFIQNQVGMVVKKLEQA